LLSISGDWRGLHTGLIKILCYVSMYVWDF